MCWFADVTSSVFRSVQSPSTAAGWQKDGRRTERQTLHDPPAQHSHQIQTSVFCCCQSKSRQCPRPGSPFRARRRNREERGGHSLKGRSTGIGWFQFQFPIWFQCLQGSECDCLQSKSTFSILYLINSVGHEDYIFTILQPSLVAVTGSPSSSGSPTGLLPSSQFAKVTQMTQKLHSQISYLKPTQARPWTPPRPALPLTAALTALSYSLSESEVSADGDEAGTGPEVLETSHMDLAMQDRTIHSLLQRPPTVQPKARSGTTADIHEVTCADRPCFPGVPCEPTVDGGFRCGRCPAGYTGGGRACRGGTSVRC